MTNETRATQITGPFTPAIVTGGASGMGKATCFSLAERGRPVSVWDIQHDAAREVADECKRRYGVPVDAQSVDLREPADMERALEASLRSLGDIGALAYVAGVTIPTAIGELATTEWSTQIEVNLTGPAILSRLMLPTLRTTGAGAAICIVASTSAFSGNENLGAYCASKAGVVGLMRSMALALARQDRIRINCVCPGATDTPMLAQSLASVSEEQKAAMDAHIPLGRMADAEEMASVIRFMLSDEASYVTGQTLIVDGGMSCGF